MKINTYTKVNNLIYILLFILLILRFLLSLTTFNNDVLNHINWVNSILSLGTKGFYQRDFSPWAEANYPPFIILLFTFFHKVFLMFRFPYNLNLLASFYKIPILISDIIIGFIFFIIGTNQKNLRRGLALMTIFFINPALFYNSVFWGQIESIVALFSLLSIIFFFSKYNIFAPFFFVLAILSKQSAFFILPIFLILLIKQNNILKVFLGLMEIYLFNIIIFSFFIIKNLISYPINFYLNTLGGQHHQNFTSVNAFNFWFLLELNNLSDNYKFLMIPIRFYSLIIISILILPIIIVLNKKISFNRVMYSIALLGFITFLFLTRMHERHMYPALVFLIPLIKSFKSLIMYIIISFISFINLFLVWGEYMAKPTMNTIILGKILSFLSIVIFIAFYSNFMKLIIKDKI